MADVVGESEKQLELERMIESNLLCVVDGRNLRTLRSIRKLLLGSSATSRDEDRAAVHSRLLKLQPRAGACCLIRPDHRWTTGEPQVNHTVSDMATQPSHWPEQSVCQNFARLVAEMWQDLGLRTIFSSPSSTSSGVLVMQRRHRQVKMAVSHLCWAHIRGDLQKMKSRICPCFHYHHQMKTWRRPRSAGGPANANPNPVRVWKLS